MIGNGSSAIQVVPKLQKVVSHLTNLIRSPTWVSPNMNTKFTRGGSGKNFACESCPCLAQLFEHSPVLQ